jgi:hypothetical protein
VHLAANSGHGIAIQLTTNGVGNEGHAYNDGNGLNQVYGNADLELTLGAATNEPFSGTIFSPRVWNGSLCYGIDLRTCNNELFDQEPPDPTISGFNSVPGGQEEADNFAHIDAWRITGATVWGAYSNSATPPVNQDIVVRFFSDSGGLPGTLLAQRTINNVAFENTGLYMGILNSPIYQYDVTFAAVTLPAGRHWISALGNEAGFTWAWARTDTVANGHAVRSGAGPWGPSAGNFAFVLCGEEIFVLVVGCAVWRRVSRRGRLAPGLDGASRPRVVAAIPAGGRAQRRTGTTGQGRQFDDLPGVQRSCVEPAPRHQ